MARIHLKPGHPVIACAFFATVIFSSGLREIAYFAKEFWYHPAQVGALVPCMPAVGKELTKYVAQFQKEHPNESCRILEVGAGTGPITAVIATMLRAGLDSVDAIEISPEFCAELHKKFDNNSNVNIECISILDWHPPYQYDFIVSTLPFNSFPFDLMKSIVNHLQLLIKSGGIFSYVAYAGIAQAKQPFLWGARKREHIEKMNVLNGFREQYEIDEKFIIINLPPINVYHLKICKN